MGLNIPYPYGIDWLPEEGKPIGLFAILGWLEDRIERLQEARAEQERKAKGFTETHSSYVAEDEE